MYHANILHLLLTAYNSRGLAAYDLPTYDFIHTFAAMRRFTVILFRSFLQGLLLLSPIAITVYLLYSVFSSIDALVPYVPRGLGFIIIIGTVTLIGYLGTRFFVGKWLFDAFANLMEHTPGVKFIYSSIRDVINSFVGDKKRFNKPVWVCVNYNPEIWRIGFMTQRDMTALGMPQKVAVYMPHAYAISGWVIITDTKNVKPVKEMTSGEAMKFAVSGGVTTVDESETNKTAAEKAAEARRSIITEEGDSNARKDQF